jgi:NADH-quinone oxidoreductase E subunit
MAHSAAPAAFEQPRTFAFTPENLKRAEHFIAKYPEGFQQSAVMPLLDLAQRQHGGWIPRAAMDTIAEMLGMPYIRVYEVASFYSMYNLAPVGTHFVQVCTTTPCWLRGSDQVMEACERHLGIQPGETTGDGKFTLAEVECLGACVNAPMMQINHHDADDANYIQFYEDLTAETTVKILDSLKQGTLPKPGPQVDRQTSAPEGGRTTLKEVK